MTISEEVINAFINAVHQLDDKVERLEHRIALLSNEIKDVKRHIGMDDTPFRGLIGDERK